ncbi:MAG: hypothetical protein ACRDRY_25235 [Pseudonocardiaceae bacterium]
MMLVPDRFFWADRRLTYSAKRLLVRLAGALLFFLLGALAVGLLDRANWREVLAGALFAWSVSGVIRALVSYRSGNASTAESVRRIAEYDLLHGRLNHLADRLGAPLLNLNEGNLNEAIAERVQRHAHMSGLEEFGGNGGRAFWDNTACGYPRVTPPA